MTENFSTSDIYLCAAMLSLGAKLESVDREDTRHMVFILSIPETVKVDGVDTYVKLSDIENKWSNKKLLVNAFDYSEAMKRMKSVVHSKF